MKRRSFFKFFAAAPAAVALPSIAENKGQTFAACPKDTGGYCSIGVAHVHTLTTCELPSHTHGFNPCHGCHYEAVPVNPGSATGPMAAVLRCKRICR